MLNWNFTRRLQRIDSADEKGEIDNIGWKGIERGFSAAVQSRPQFTIVYLVICYAPYVGWNEYYYSVGITKSHSNDWNGKVICI